MQERQLKVESNRAYNKDLNSQVKEKFKNQFKSATKLSGKEFKYHMISLKSGE